MVLTLQMESFGTRLLVLDLRDLFPRQDIRAFRVAGQAITFADMSAAMQEQLQIVSLLKPSQLRRLCLSFHAEKKAFDNITAEMSAEAAEELLGGQLLAFEETARLLAQMRRLERCKLLCPLMTQTIQECLASVLPGMQALRYLELDFCERGEAMPDGHSLPDSPILQSYFAFNKANYSHVSVAGTEEEQKGEAEADKMDVDCGDSGATKAGQAGKDQQDGANDDAGDGVPYFRTITDVMLQCESLEACSLHAFRDLRLSLDPFYKPPLSLHEFSRSFTRSLLDAKTASPDFV